MTQETENNVLLRSLNLVCDKAGLARFKPVSSEAELCLLPSGHPKLAFPARSGFSAWKNSAELYPAISSSHLAKKAVLVGGYPVWCKREGLQISDFQRVARHLHETLSDNPQCTEKVVSFAIRGGSAGAGEKLIFQFQDERGVPLSYIKVGDTVHRAPFLRNERDIFQALETSEASFRLPRVLGYTEFQGLEALEIEALNGARYFPSPEKNKVVQLLIDLFRKTAVSTYWNPPEWMNDYSVLERPETRSFVEERVFKVCSIKIPCPLVHRDLAAWNIFSLGGRLGALDWEYGRSAHLPFQDLFHYLLHTEMNRGRRKPMDVYKAVFSNAENIKAITTYAKEVGIEDSAFIDAVRVAYLWDWFSFERSRATEQSTQGSEYEEILNGLAEQ